MKTLQQVILQSKKQDVEQFARLWAIDERKEEVPLRTVLTQRLRDPIAARFVWEHLSRDERLVLFPVMGQSSRNWIRRDALQKKVQLPEGPLEAAITSLKQRMLLFEEQVKMQGNYMYSSWYSPSPASKVEEVPILYTLSEITAVLYTTGREIFVPTYDRSKMTLHKILTPYQQSDLHGLAMNYRLDANSYTYYGRAELRSMLVEELLQPEMVFFALQQLDPIPRKLFEWVCEREGKVSMEAVRKHLGCDDADLFPILQSFADFAIAFDTFSDNERVLFVPQDMYANLKRAKTQPEPEEVQSGLVMLDSPPATVRSSDTFILYDLAVLIGAVYQQNIEPTQAGRVPKRIATKIRPLLHGQTRGFSFDSEDEYLEMLLGNARKLELLQLSESPIQEVKEHYEPGPRLEQWSQMDIIEQTKMLLQEWAKSYDWLDTYGANYVSWNAYSWNPLGARSILQKYLQECVPGRWYSVASLLQTIWDKDPFALRPMEQRGNPLKHPKTSAMHAKWNGSDGEVYIGSLSSTLYELGIVSLGYQQPGLPEEDTPVNPDAFMLTGLGATVLSSHAEPGVAIPHHLKPNGNRTLVVQPNFELLLLQPDMPTLYSVLPFAQVEQVGVVSRLKLTRNSLLRGAGAGLSIERILQVLEERSQKEIPQNVAYMLRDWVKNYKDTRISQVILLEVLNENQADEMCASSKLQTFGLRRLGPCALAVSNKVNLSELRRTLEKEGIVVRMSGDIVTQGNRYAVTFGTLR